LKQTKRTTNLLGLFSILIRDKKYNTWVEYSI